MGLVAALVFLSGCSEEANPRSACDDAASGNAMPVEIVIRSGASTGRFHATKCDSPFRVLSPKSGYAPANPSVLLCDTAPTSCDSTCMDVGLTPLSPGESKSFTWDGVVYVSVDAANEGCPAANAGASCFSNCVRRQDGDVGEYKLTVRVYEEDLTLTEYETKFVYPKQTKVLVEIP